MTRNNYVNVLKDHIKNILNIDLTDQEADQYIVNTFRLDNPNPMYTFVLSDQHNDTIFFHRNDFTEAIFPNVTTLQKLRKIMIDSKLMPENVKDQRESRLIDEKFLFNFEKFKNMSHNSEYDDLDDVKIVEENVRTERNFIQFMDNLNSLGTATNSNKSTSSNEGRSISLHDHYPQTGGWNSQWDIGTTKKPIPQKISWDDLGLHGWRGDILKPNGEENNKHMYVDSDLIFC